MKRRCIIYYSWRGNNRFLAEDLQKRLDCDIIRVEEKKRRTTLKTFLDYLFKRRPVLKPIKADLKTYNHIILVAPIWAGLIATPMTTFIRAHHTSFSSYSFMSLCLGTPNIKTWVTQQLKDLIGKKPKAISVLKYNRVLPLKDRNTIRGSMKYRITPKDYTVFEKQIKTFCKTVSV